MLDSYATLLFLLGVSIIAGIFGSMLGLGGGFIIAPTLIMINMEPYKVSATSLFTVFSTSLSSTISYSRQGRIDYRLAYKLASLAFPGSIIGAYVSSIVDVQEFKLYFAIILVGVSLHMLIRSSYERVKIRYSKTKHYNYAIAFSSGLIAGLFGIGGGVLLIPMMLILMRMGMHRAVPNAQFVILTSSLAGLITHAILGHPDYLIASILVGGTFIGAQIGSRFIDMVKDVILRYAVASALFLIASRLVYDYLTSSG